MRGYIAPLPTDPSVRHSIIYLGQIALFFRILELYVEAYKGGKKLKSDVNKQNLARRRKNFVIT